VPEDFEVEPIKGPLTRSLKSQFSDLVEEVSAAYAEYIPVTEGQSLWFQVDSFVDVVLQNGQGFLYLTPHAI
jgi:hypothetical protein